MGCSIYGEKPNAITVNQALNAISVSLLFITLLWIHVSKMDVHFSLYLQEQQYVDKILSLVSRLMCQTRTHTEKGNEYIIYAAHSRAGRCHVVYSAGSCKFLLNHQGVIDRKTMRCHFAGATVINTFVFFFFLHVLRGIIVLLASIPPQCSEYVLKWL